MGEERNAGKLKVRDLEKVWLSLGWVGEVLDGNK